MAAVLGEHFSFNSVGGTSEVYVQFVNKILQEH